MTSQTKRARQGCSPYPAHLPHKFDLKKELTTMLHINPQSGKTASSRRNNDQSPWITQRDHHIFGYELSIAKDNLPHPDWKPHPFFEWVLKNNAENKILDALAACCPVFPAIGYRNTPFTYLAPPPSGLVQTVVYIVVGHDPRRNLRAVGCNYDSVHRSQQPSPDFFSEFDSLTQKDDKAEYIKKEVCSRMTSNEVSLLKRAKYEAEKIGTMPVVIVALDQESGPHFAIDTAVIKPWGSCDSTYEFAGEVL
jgi:hypothetical protein